MNLRPKVKGKKETHMEFRQLECFIKTAELGSTRRAAEALYTSQSSVSKYIAMLEDELGLTLFVRTNKGVHLTDAGRECYQQACGILQGTRLMKEMSRPRRERRISIACYPSTMISHLFCLLYNDRALDKCRMVFLEGTVREIVGYVDDGTADMGIVYIARDQRKIFDHVLGHKELVYTEISQHEPCIYVGPKSPLYNRQSITFAELEELPFIQPMHDFFSIEHHLDTISVGMAKASRFKSLFFTNSDNQIIEMLLHTDICNFGIRLMNRQFGKYPIRDIPLEGCGKCLSFGYIKRKQHEISEEYDLFLGMLRDHLCAVQNAASLSCNKSS